VHVAAHDLYTRCTDNGDRILDALNDPDHQLGEGAAGDGSASG
jgi:hypothetical protein